MQTTVFTLKQLATVLKARRRALKLTQKDIAALVGLPSRHHPAATP